MHVNKLQITDSNGLIPAGQYFKLLAKALRKANAREAAKASVSPLYRRAETMVEASH